MTTRHAILALLLLSAVGSAFAAGITVQAPLGDTMDPARDRFSFSTDSYDTIAECRLIIDGNASKRASYNDVIKGRSLSFAADTYEDGTYAWSVECETTDGVVLSSGERNITIQRPETQVTVTPSGVFRGSMLHSFTVSADPIDIPDVAAGDYLGITADIFPSKITKELYVKSRLVENGVPKLWMTYRQEDYYLRQGENVTVPVGSSSVILHFRGISLNRVTLVAYPVGGAPDSAGEPVGDAAPEEPVLNEPEPPAPVAEEEAPETTDEAPAAERPGAWRRFVSWLVRLFGA